MILLNTWEAAQRFGVVPATLRKWTYDGKLEPIRTPGGHLRFRKADVDSLLEAQGMEVTDDPRDNGGGIQDQS